MIQRLTGSSAPGAAMLSLAPAALRRLDRDHALSRDVAIERERSRLARDENAARVLWEISEEIVDLRYP